MGDHTTIYSVVSGSPSYPTSVLHSLVDRLGSPSVLLTGRDSTPNVIRYRAHGIFGRPIDGGTGNKLINLADWDDFNRGYTGHEQLIEQQLIHMNGRVYDYNLGRFMSVDPFIQSPSNSQSFNPYSYIMNNPMAGVDPTGYVARGTNASNWRTSGCDLDPMGCTSTRAERALATYVGGGQGNMHQSFADNLESFNDRMEEKREENWTKFAYAGIGTVTITDLPSDIIKTNSELSADKSYVMLASSTAAAGEGAAVTGLGEALAAGIRYGAGGAIIASTLTISGDTVKDEEDQYQYVTYTRLNPVTRQVYAGRTGGYGAPEEIIHRRSLGQPHLTAEGFLLPTVDRWSTDRAAIRGREQQLIDFYGGARSVGGSARNLINGVADYNPNRPFYMNAARKAFGDLPDNSPDRFRLDWK